MVVHVSGLLRGAELAGMGTLMLVEDGLSVAPERGAPLAIRLTSVDGIASRADGVDLFLDSGDVLHLRGGEPGVVATAVARHAFALPEVTRSLRALGSRRSSPDALHDRYFAALLAARRRGEMLADPHDRARAFEAGALRGSLERLLLELAAERGPASPAGRRAMEAELHDCAATLLGRIDALARAERALRDADDAVRLARWRDWVSAMRLVFEEADACWPALRPLLDRERNPAPAWRRWLGLGA
jgi:hypothetical protein